MSEPIKTAAVSPRTFGPMNYLRGIAGAILGGLVGYGIYHLLYSYNFYAGILPGACLGAGAGYASGGKSYGMGAICLVMGAVLSIVGEWLLRFAELNSFMFYLENIREIGTINMIMLGLGTFAAFWFGMGRNTLFTHGRR